MNYIDAELRSMIAAEYRLSDRTYILRSIEKDGTDEVRMTKRRFGRFRIREESTC